MAIQIGGYEILTDEGEVKNVTKLKLEGGDDTQTYITVSSIGLTEMQGTVAGFTVGGVSTPGYYTEIQKMPFAQSEGGVATNIADLATARTRCTTSTGGADAIIAAGSTTGNQGVRSLEKFPFAIASGTSISPIGLWPSPVVSYGGVGHSSETHGYHGADIVTQSSIGRFPFAIPPGFISIIPGAAPGWIPSTSPAFDRAAASSSTDGYMAGGFSPPAGARVTRIEKFPFAVSSGLTSEALGDLSEGKNGVAGVSGPTDGFVFGGLTGSIYVDDLEKFPYGSGVASSTIGNLLPGVFLAAGYGSASHGFFTGGGTGPVTGVNAIRRFPYANYDAAINLAGSLTQNTKGTTGIQD